MGFNSNVQNSITKLHLIEYKCLKCDEYGKEEIRMCLVTCCDLTETSIAPKRSRLALSAHLATSSPCTVFVQQHSELDQGIWSGSNLIWPKKELVLT